MIVEAYKNYWERAFDFSGLSNRGDYWWAYLANIVILFVFSLLTLASETFLPVYYLYSFATIIPSTSICIRRVRDSGKSWQWIFINIIPIVGVIWFIALLCQPSLLKAGKSKPAEKSL